MVEDKDYIKIKGCQVHNLKNIDLKIPKDKLVVITGISGSGKSSLAFDTLYAEGQRRYVESLSAYARQFLGMMDKPKVDKIEGISPAISIDQRKAAHNPRSTVGTITEIADLLRLLFARVGIPHCPQCGKLVSSQTIDQIVEQIMSLPQEREIMVLGPVVKGRKGEHKGILEEVQRGGFVRARIDGLTHRIEEALELDLNRYKKHNIEVVVDRLITGDLDRSRVVDSVETGLKLGKGVVMVSQKKENKQLKDLIFSERFACEECGVNLPEIEPRLFSFNSPYGACSECDGLGEKLEVDPKLVLPNPELTIGEGAVFPWAHASHKIGRQSYFKGQLSKMAQEYDFSLDTPLKNLSQKAIDVILQGDDEFEGVVSNLKRRHRETDSKHTRKEIEKYMVKKICPKCKGKRLKPEALAVKIDGKSIAQIVKKNISQNIKFFKNLKDKLSAEKKKIATPIIKEIVNRLTFLENVGLHYITLNRKAATLAGGEEQRTRLATQIGSKLTGILYILDEPSVGLHSRDQGRLIETLKELRDLGNTIIVVEHDPQTIKESDWVIDIGPGAGKNGGKVVFEGTPKQLKKAKTITGKYLSGKKKVEVKESNLKKESNENSKKSSKSGKLDKKKKSDNPEEKKEEQSDKFLIIRGAQEHNLKGIDVKVPLEKFVCITGVSGAGKSSLVDDTLARVLHQRFYQSFKKPGKSSVSLLFSEEKGVEEPGKYKEILGTEHLNKVAIVDQSPIGRTPRSNPATYTKAFDYIRKIFAKTKQAKLRGYKPGRFSFNVKGGRCEACDGQGVKKIEMYFLPDVYVECKECKGTRYNKETLEIEYKGKNISQVLNMTVEESLEFFENIPSIKRKLKTLNQVGLGYLELGQPAPSLSGGEAQRIKLARELSKKLRGNALYILDEPTTGLHPHDIKNLLFVLKRLTEQGNTVLCVEHNLDVIKNADWVIDLGPEGGERGGQIVEEGSPEKIAKNKESYTGKYLKKVL